MKNKHRGSSFDDFLKDEGLLEECKIEAMKRVAAFRAEQRLKNHVLDSEDTCDSETLIMVGAK